MVRDEGKVWLRKEWRRKKRLNGMSVKWKREKGIKLGRRKMEEK